MAKSKNGVSNDIFDGLPIAICVVDAKSLAIQKLNPAFESLTQFEESKLVEEKKKLEDIIYKKDLKKLTQRLEHLEEDQHIEAELRIITKKRGGMEVVVTIKKQTTKKKSSLLCTFRNIEAQREFEQELRDKLEEEKRKAGETVKGIIQTKQLLEKLYRAPNVLRELWSCQKEQNLLDKMVAMMCHEKGLNYANATILLKEGDYLVVRAAHKKQALHRFNLSKDHKFAQVFRGEKKIVSESTGEYSLPILSPAGGEGIIQVILNEKERNLISESDALKTAHRNLIQLVSQSLGYSLFSIRNSLSSKSTFQHNMVSVVEDITSKMEAKEEFYILWIDIDNFSSMLSEYETSLIDLILPQVAESLHEYKSPGNLLTQVGDDEFLLMIPSNFHKTIDLEAKQLERKLQQIDLENEGKKVKLTFSIGAASYQAQDDVTAQEILLQAGNCLKASQKIGGDRIFLWDGSPQEVPKRVSRRLT